MKRKIGSMLLSIACAFALWLYVITSVSPGSTDTYYNIPIVWEGESVLNERGLMVTAVSSNTVNLRLSGNRSDLSKVNSAQHNRVHRAQGEEGAGHGGPAGNGIRQAQNAKHSAQNQPLHGAAEHGTDGNGQSQKAHVQRPHRNRAQAQCPHSQLNGHEKGQLCQSANIRTCGFHIQFLLLSFRPSPDTTHYFCPGIPLSFFRCRSLRDTARPFPELCRKQSLLYQGFCKKQPLFAGISPVQEGQTL